MRVLPNLLRPMATARTSSTGAAVLSSDAPSLSPDTEQLDAAASSMAGGGQQDSGGDDDGGNDDDDRDATKGENGGVSPPTQPLVDVKGDVQGDNANEEQQNQNNDDPDDDTHDEDDVLGDKW